MLDKKKLLIVFIILAFVVIIVARRAVKDVSVLEQEKAPVMTAPAVRQKALEKMPEIKPIVIKEQEFEAKPQSSDPEDWDAYSKKVFSDLKAAMSEEMSEKISQELSKRKNPEVEKNLERLDEEIKVLEEEAAQNPDENTREKLIKLLEVRSKYKYLQETFIK